MLQYCRYRFDSNTSNPLNWVSIEDNLKISKFNIHFSYTISEPSNCVKCERCCITWSLKPSNCVTGLPITFNSCISAPFNVDKSEIPKVVKKHDNFENFYTWIWWNCPAGSLRIRLFFADNNLNLGKFVISTWSLLNTLLSKISSIRHFKWCTPCTIVSSLPDASNTVRWHINSVWYTFVSD